MKNPMKMTRPDGKYKTFESLKAASDKPAMQRKISKACKTGELLDGEKWEKLDHY